MSTTVRRISSSKDNSKDNVSGLRVIGVGLPRTGTMSLAAAFEILGFSPCHHMIDLFKKPNRTVEFIRAYDGEKVDFYELMKGYGSTVDAPTIDFYKEIHQAYPQSKMILTVRDNDEKWFASFQNTIGSSAMNNFYYFCVYPIRFLRLQHILGRKIIQRWKSKYNEITPSLHSKYNKRIIDEHQEGEILIYNVKEGWEPLCKFLEVDIPEDIPFPNVNDTKEFKRNIIIAKAIGLSAWAVIGALFIFGIYKILY